MRTTLQFSMDADSSAPDRVGCYLMPSIGRYDVRWDEQSGRATVTVTVVEAAAERFKRRICRLHPTVRLVRESRADS